MFTYFVPDYIFDEFDQATADFLVSIKVKGIVLDIDNTLEPYENRLPGSKVLTWLSTLEEKGIKASIVSNNNKERVTTFNESIGLPAYFKGGKPFKKNVVRAMKEMETSKENTILMGDQIFTDVWAARNAGIRAILVSPIKDKKDVFTKFKRQLEKIILRKK